MDTSFHWTDGVHPRVIDAFSVREGVGLGGSRVFEVYFEGQLCFIADDKRHLNTYLKQQEV